MNLCKFAFQSCKSIQINSLFLETKEVKTFNQLREKLDKIQTKNVKGILSLLAGNTIVQVVLVISGFVLAKLYGPDNYGFYNVYLSFVGIVSVFSTLRMENVLVLSKDTKEIKNLFNALFILSFFIIVVVFLFYLLADAISNFRTTSAYLIFFCCLGGLLTAWNSIQNIYLTKYKFFNKISKGLVLGAVATVSFQVLGAVLGLDKYGLIYGAVLGVLATFIYYLMIFKSRIAKIDVPSLKKTFSRNSEIIKYTFPSDLVNSVANNIMPILILVYFTQKEAGLYAMSVKIMATPLLLLSNSVAKVYFQKAAHLYNYKKEQLYSFSKKVVLSNIGLIFIYLLLINTLGIYLLILFLGESWSEVQIYILPLSFWILARSGINPIASIVVVIRKNNYALIFNLYLLITCLFSIYIGYFKKDFLAVVLSFSFLSGVGYLVYLLVVMLSLKKLKA